MPLDKSLDSRSGPLPPRTLPRSRTRSRARLRAKISLLLAVPLAGVVAMSALAAGLSDPAAAAETSYLAFAAGLVLLATGAVAESVRVPVLGTTAVVALVWLVPAGPSRGFLVEAAAALALAFAALQRAGLTRSASPTGGARGRDGVTGTAALLCPVPALGLAFGLQALLRADELLAPRSIGWTLAVYAALPVLGALAALALARLDGPAPAALAAGTVLLLGPGFRPATVTALVALAAAAVLLADRGALDRFLGQPGLFGRAGLADRPDDSPAAALRRLAPILRPLTRVAAVGLLTAPAAWSPSTAFIAALAGMAFALRRRAWSAPLCCAVAAGGAWASILTWGGRGLPEAAALAAAVPLAVPALVRPVLAWRDRERIGLAVTSLVLAIAAAIMVPVDGALAAPGALAAAAAAAGATGPSVSIGSRGRHAPRAAIALQGTWSALLLTGAALAGAYPWLRPAPLATVLASLGLAADWTGAVVVLVLALAILGAAPVAAALWHRLDRARAHRSLVRTPSLTVAVVGALAALALLLHVPGTGLELIRASTPVVLSGGTDGWSATLDGATAGPSSAGGRVRAIAVDSSLSNAADLPFGTPVATLALQRSDRPERIWILRAGEETGEWAADRSRRLGQAMPAAPAPWRSWIPDEGRFFGHRYRTELRVSEPLDAPGENGDGFASGRIERVELRLRPDLPPDVALTVFRLELSP